MTNGSLHECVVNAMQERIDKGGPFKAKQVASAGLQFIIRWHPQHPDYQHPFKDEPWSLGFVKGDPISRMADKLLQKNRKAGRISFKAGWWHSAPTP